MVDGEIRVDTSAPGVYHVELDRRAKRNALTPELLEALSTFLTRFDDDDAARVAVLSFAGDHACAGLDLGRFARHLGAGDDGIGTELVDPFGMRRRLLKPLVVAVQGAVYTAGIEMMLAADIVVAAENSRFAQAEVVRGLAPFGGATARYLERMGWGEAMRLLLTGREYGAHEAYRLGLVQEVVPVGCQVPRALELAGEIAAAAPLGVRFVKRQAEAWRLGGAAAANALTADGMRQMGASADAREGMAAFVERRPARFEGR